MTIKVVQIGIGWMGEIHAKTWKEIQNAYLGAICDIRSDAQSIAKMYAERFYTDHALMIKEENPDIVDIVVPASDHARILENVLDLDVPYVNIEKPAVPLEELAQGKELIKLANEAGTIVSVGDSMAYDPTTKELKKILPSLGNLESIICDWQNPHNWKVDVGVNSDLGPHIATIPRVLTDWTKFYLQDYKAVRIYDRNRIDYVWLQAVSDSYAGVYVNFLGTAKWAPEKIRRATVVGSDAIAEANFNEGQRFIRIITRELIEKKRISEKGYNEEGKLIVIPKEQPIYNELNHLVDCVKSHELPITSLERSIETLEMLYPTAF